MIAVDGGVATVELGRSEACAACGLCGAHGGRMRMTVDAVRDVAPGRQVLVAVDRSVPLIGILLLFGFPMLGLVAGALLGHAYPFAGLSPDGAAVTLAGVFLAATFAVALVYDRTIAARTMPRPHIVRVLGPKEPDLQE